MGPLDDSEQRELLQQARGGAGAQRDAALQRLLDDFRGPALAVIHKTLRSCGLEPLSLAEEVLQQATFKFISVGLSAFRGSAAPRTYFVRIAINAALDAGRRQARLAHLEPEQLQQAAPQPAADDLMDRAQLRVALQRCVEGLPGRYERSVRLFYLEEAGSCARCAELAGVSRAAFMQQLFRARAMLADCLRRALGGR